MDVKTHSPCRSHYSLQLLFGAFSRTRSNKESGGGVKDNTLRRPLLTQENPRYRVSRRCWGSLSNLVSRPAALRSAKARATEFLAAVVLCRRAGRSSLGKSPRYLSFQSDLGSPVL